MAFINKNDIKEVLITADQIDQKLSVLAKEVDDAYKNITDDLVLVGVLNGATFVMTDFSKKLKTSLQIDFITLSSYGFGTKSSGVVRVLKDISIDITDKHILIVEDIIDSGFTLRWLVDNLKSRGAKSVEVLSLLVKEQSVQKNFDRIVPKWLGFLIPDLFVVGYGLDYAHKYRHLPYIAVLNSSIVQS